jgi:hypothetical protein
LRHRVGLVGAAGQSAGQAKDAFVVRSHELIEGLMIAAPGPPDQLGFDYFVHAALQPKMPVRGAF